jgi:type IV pilus biogenesis protein CpaD/CtpE
MQVNNINRISMLALLMASLAGCATSSTPQFDSGFGDAVNAARAQQTINPEASLNTKPVDGMDGEAANSVMDRYHQSFQKPPATGNIFNIGVGGGAGSSGSSSGSGSSR